MRKKLTKEKENKMNKHLEKILNTTANILAAVLSILNVLGGIMLIPVVWIVKFLNYSHKKYLSFKLYLYEKKLDFKFYLIKRNMS